MSTSRSGVFKLLVIALKQWFVFLWIIASSKLQWFLVLKYWEELHLPRAPAVIREHYYFFSHFALKFRVRASVSLIPGEQGLLYLYPVYFWRVWVSAWVEHISADSSFSFIRNLSWDSVIGEWITGGTSNTIKRWNWYSSFLLGHDFQ